MKKYKFKAKIEAGDGGGAYVPFPYDTGKEFATKGKVPVKATFDGLCPPEKPQESLILGCRSVW
jgi:hypothetical protein